MPLQLSSRDVPSFFQRPAGPRAAPVSTGARRLASQQSSLAELMLLNRLRACTRHDLTADTLARAAAVIGVTARQWFGEAERFTVAREPGA